MPALSTVFRASLSAALRPKPAHWCGIFPQFTIRKLSTGISPPHPAGAFSILDKRKRRGKPRLLSASAANRRCHRQHHSTALTQQNPCHFVALATVKENRRMPFRQLSMPLHPPAASVNKILVLFRLGCCPPFLSLSRPRLMITNSSAGDLFNRW